ncbi:MAG: hypothetical protein E7616_09295 [Ruminococcaceae bacterium]|nr:hypothetical protein [Oscillospiraceae bacterium]
MNKKELTAAVKKMAYDLGADMVGIAPVSRFDGQPHMLRPEAHLPGAKSVICFGVHHPDASVEWCGEPNPNFPAAFQIGMIPKLDTMCYRITKMLEKEGYPTVGQPTTTYWRHRAYKDIPYEHAASFSHMAAFVACGLGEYGYHGMVLSPEYGPRERIISIITTAELEPDPLYNGPALCDRCKLCAKNCIGQNYDMDKLNTPNFIEFEIEGKKFSYLNINRWRCFFGEQAHLDTTKLADIVNLDEQGIYEAMKTVPRVENHGYMCKSFKYCMTKGKRAFDKKYTPGVRRKKTLSDISKKEMLDRIVEMAIENGAEFMHIEPLKNFEHVKSVIDDGFRTEQFFEFFTTVITFGRHIHDYDKDIPMEARNAQHIERPTTDRLTSALIDVSRYLDDLGYEAIQDWTYCGISNFDAEAWDVTGISDCSARNAGWTKDGKNTFAASVICNIPFEAETRVLRDWDEPCFPKLDTESNLFAHVEMVSVGTLDGIQCEGIERIKKLYPDCKSIVAIANAIPETIVNLACKQEAEDGASYAYMHYETLKECIWAGEDLCSALEKKGYKAITLPDLVPDSYLTIGKLGRHMPDLCANAPFAAAAGLGSLGKSGMLVRPDCGPRLRFVFVLTNAPLEPTTPVAAPKCDGGCTACAEACPMKALSGSNMKTVTIRDGESYPVMVRNETRCMWSRSLALCEGAGSAQLGWEIPDLEVPETITPEKIEEALNAKDKIQTLCYQCPNFTDIIVERCLQICPIGKSNK